MSDEPHLSLPLPSKTFGCGRRFFQSLAQIPVNPVNPGKPDQPLSIPFTVKMDLDDRPKLSAEAEREVTRLWRTWRTVLEMLVDRVRFPDHELENTED